ncbi:MAG: hypothetical protein PHQ35_09420 [Phycisphaerae bacterium]|nr:hypothetical protein [Phycisphaerae bacterium]
MTVIDENKNEIQLRIFAECTCGNLAFILENPSGRRFTRCSFCGKEYLEKNGGNMNFLFSIMNRSQYEACMPYSDKIDGVEVCVDKVDREYLDLLHKYHFKILQFHMPDLVEDDLLVEINKFKKTLLVLHPPDKNVAKMSREIISKTHHSVTLENLNPTNGKKRLDLDGVCKVVKKVKGLGLCWDIGHENQTRYNYSTPITPQNVHLHDFNHTDHQPFYYGNVDYRKAMEYLTKTGYKGNVVVEFAFEYLHGDTMGEKIQEYLKQISMIRGST